MRHYQNKSKSLPVKPKLSQNFKIFCSMVTVLSQERWNEKSFLIEPRELDTIHEDLNSSSSRSSDFSTDGSFGIEPDEINIKSLVSYDPGNQIMQADQLSFEMKKSIYLSPINIRFRSSLHFERTSSLRLIEINKKALIGSSDTEIHAGQRVDSMTSSTLDFMQNEALMEQQVNFPR